jgi:RNA polymerase II subunit A-like phosphatase
MGRKSYAKAILDKIDPYRTLFQGQILTRDSNGSMNKKRLDRIFPSDTSTVLILDDCTEVWNGCPNLIHIKPYEYFIGVDEVNCVPSLNKFRLSSAKRSFLRLSNSALSQSFMKENEDDEDEDEIERNGDENDVKDQIISVESDSNDDTVVNSSGEETRYEASTLETVQDFSFDYVSSDAYKNDAFSIPSGLRKNEKENSDSFDSYFDQCIADIIPSQPEQDDILDSTRKVSNIV